MAQKFESFLSEFLREARVKAQLNQSDVAKKLGYSNAQFVSNWERGLSSPPVKCLPKLAKIYSINAEELFEAVIEETLALKRREFEQGMKRMA